MTALLASTFIGILMFVMGFWLARMIYREPAHEFGIMVPKSTRTDAENAAGMVS